MAQHGPAAVIPFTELNAVVNELIHASVRRSRIVTKRALAIAASDPERSERFDRERQQVDAIFYRRFDEDDPIHPRVDAAITAIERTCRDIIDSKGTLFSYVNWRIPWTRKH